jgi:hypothetical protein
MSFSVKYYTLNTMETAVKQNMMVTPKLMPTLLCWPTTSEADVGDLAVEVESSRQYSVKFCCRVTDDCIGAV